jgi:cysteate synthase
LKFGKPVDMARETNMEGTDRLQPAYTLRCQYCGKEFQDAFDGGFLLDCTEKHLPALLKTSYNDSAFSPQPERPGIFRYANWLPVHRTFKTAPSVSVFQGRSLGRLLGLENLWIAFNGYWPDRGAFFETGTFKELESYAVCARIPEMEKGFMVVSSAGNTARAFIQICSDHSIPVVVIVPEAGLPSLWSTHERKPCVKIAVIDGGADYADAIRLGNTLARTPGFFSEGGVKNIGRRDGLGTVLLSAAEKTGQIPEHYFQAIGSGTGAIAVWEMKRRLTMDARFGARKMTLHLSQNSPFTPIFDAWNSRSKTLLPSEEKDQKEQILKIRSHILSNRQPPYSITGGVHDALSDSNGCMYAVSNEDAVKAGSIFSKEEGCDLDPAGEVTVASLFQAIELGRIGKTDFVLLNITGGGFSLIRRDMKLFDLKPDMTLSLRDIDQPNTIEKLANLVTREY